MSLLEVKNLKVSYGGIQAVKGIDLHIDQGELVTLIGANGAGKTTTLRTLVGMVKPAEGSIVYDGKPTGKIPVYDFVRNGLVMVPEGRGVFGRLTVEENLRMGAYYRNDESAIRDEIDYVYELFPRLKERMVQLAGTLSGGEQQMVAMGRAMLSKPKLLLLDEPSMGLAPIIVQKIFEIVQQTTGGGPNHLSETLVTYSYSMTFNSGDYGYGMSLATFTFLLSLVITGIYSILTRERGE